MRMYCTSKNSGPSYGSDPVRMVYLGTSVEEAEAAVGSFVNYQRDENHFPNTHNRRFYSALPMNMEWEMIQFYMADGWWFSIVMFEVADVSK